mmetsp:Transcript_88710/g.185464  ORF Transcript_88710/g.185464 Transcript_88710/m.185464 type:complete len:116 (-) Transcript_88710:2800-3147(-)
MFTQNEKYEQAASKRRHSPHMPDGQPAMLLQSLLKKNIEMLLQLSAAEECRGEGRESRGNPALYLSPQHHAAAAAAPPSAPSSSGTSFQANPFAADSGTCSKSSCFLKGDTKKTA